MSDVARPTGGLGEVFRAALGLGLTSFGGPIAHIGYFRREYVERRRWLDDRAFADLLALCQSLPGPASSQLGIALGAQRAGIAGGLVSWIGFTVPSAILLVLFGLASSSVDVASAGWVHGLKLAAVAVVAQALIALARALTPDPPRIAVAAVAAGAALVATTPFTQVTIIAAGAAIGLVGFAVPPSPPGIAGSGGPIGRRTGLVAIVLFFGLLVGLPILRAATGSTGVAMVETFYRTGSLVFGGGHVVLPLLDAGVVDPGWVSEDRFLAGYGAAQAIPGPLFSFAAYLGSVAVPPLGGWSGAAVALTTIYLPTFLLVFGVLPFWDRLRGSDAFRRALIGANAAVVGLLAAAFYDPIWTGAIGAPIDIAVAAVGFGLLLTGRVPPIVVVAASAAAGQLLGGAT
ncbi:MAG TPA: chromate efflux transporter [Candidatus Limnocylindrales bacterium]|nr:chromate efflux transporter [Candidatus Limnocylindrales bacterium]